MVSVSSDQKVKPVIKGMSYFLAHVPGMVRHGSKPSREIEKNPSLLSQILSHLETFDQAVAYPPNQVFIGNIDPDDLLCLPSPYYKNPIPNASRWGAFGEMMPEEEFYGMMKICDEFQLLLLEEGFLKEVVLKLRLRADPNGNIDVLRVFGSQKAETSDLNIDGLRIADPILLHAEVLLQPGERVRKEAQELIKARA